MISSSDPNPPDRPQSLRVILPFIVSVIIPMLLISCKEEKKSVMDNVDPETFPTMSTTDVSTLVSDSGYIRYHLTTDLWLVYDEAVEPRWTFPTGINMQRYDDTLGVNATFVADSATYLSSKRIWQFDGNVRMKNVNGDSFETQQLFWDQNQKKVYSDSFIHIERIDRILEGYGFNSNEDMTEYTITRVSGIFPTPERREHPDEVEVDEQEEESRKDSVSAHIDNANTLRRHRTIN